MKIQDGGSRPLEFRKKMSISQDWMRSTKFGGQIMHMHHGHVEIMVGTLLVMDNIAVCS